MNAKILSWPRYIAHLRVHFGTNKKLFDFLIENGVNINYNHFVRWFSKETRSVHYKKKKVVKLFGDEILDCKPFKVKLLELVLITPSKTKEISA